jgi:hypothetical protein
MADTIQVLDTNIDTTSGILLWQYNTASKLTSLLIQKQQWYQDNISQFWSDWIMDVFNLPTATDFGCIVWSIILNISLSFPFIPDPEGKPLFGFGSETGTPNTYKNFTDGTIVNIGGNFTNGNGLFFLNLEEKRFILMLRWFQIISRGTIPDANLFFTTIFNAAGYDGKMYLVDNLDMTMSLYFTSPAPSRLRFILSNYDIMPKPAGVKLLYPWS